MARIPRLKAGDSDPFPLWATSPQGVGADLTGATLTLTAQRSRASAPVNLNVSGVDLLNGHVQWDRQPNELVPGCWHLELTAVKDGQQKTFPSNTTSADYLNIEVVANLGGTP